MPGLSDHASLLHPQPEPGRLAPRPAPDPRLRAVHHRSASSSRSGSASGAGSPAAAVRGQVTDIAIWAVPFGIVGGRLYHVITDPARYFGARRRPGRRRSTSGRAASASGARSPSAASAPGSAAAAAASRCRRSPTRSRPASRSRRRSAGGATGSTRSCSAGRPTCRGAWRSTRRTAPPGYAELRDVPPDVPLRVRSGTSASPALVIWADRRFRLGHGRAFALYVAGLHRRPRLDRGPAHRPEANDVLRAAAQRLDLDRASSSARRRTSWSVGPPAHPGREDARASSRRQRPRAGRGSRRDRGPDDGTSDEVR